MAIITFISDFGLKDHYVSSVKGAIYSKLPNVNIVDISHQIEKFNIQGAAFLLKETYKNFPPSTVHIVGVLTETKSASAYVVVEQDGHFFVAADNGIFSLLFDEMPTKVYRIPIESSVALNFPVKDIFVEVACKLAEGADVASVGVPKQELLQRLPFRATRMGDNIKGSIIYIDSYGNIITNIDKALFEREGKGKQFLLAFAKGHQIDKISREYSDVPEGEILALFNSSGYLEIAQRNGNMSALLGLKLNEQITINFQ